MGVSRNIPDVLQATLALAQRVERAEIEFCAAGAGIGVAGGAATIEVGGGRAVCGRPASPLNKVLGLGLGVDVTDEELDALEVFYEERDCPIQIELCPLVSTDLVARLHGRGYVLKGFENELGRVMPESAPPGNGLTVEVLTGDRDVDAFLQATVESFAVPDTMPPPPDGPAPEATEAIERAMRSFVHPGVVRYLVRIDGEPAGAAAAVVTNGVLGIFGTGTRPKFRRRGVQSAIVARALGGAIGTADLAVATTEPGSVSQRTFERLGFQVLYTRAILLRD